MSNKNNNITISPEEKHAQHLAKMRKLNPSIKPIVKNAKEIKVNTKLDGFKKDVLAYANKLMQREGVKGFTSVINVISRKDKTTGKLGKITTLETLDEALRFVTPVTLKGINGKTTRGYLLGIMDIYWNNPKLLTSYEYFPSTENDANMIAMDKIPDELLPIVDVEYNV